MGKRPIPGRILPRGLAIWRNVPGGGRDGDRCSKSPATRHAAGYAPPRRACTPKWTSPDTRTAQPKGANSGTGASAEAQISRSSTPPFHETAIGGSIGDLEAELNTRARRHPGRRLTPDCVRRDIADRLQAGIAGPAVSRYLEQEKVTGRVISGLALAVEVPDRDLGIDADRINRRLHDADATVDIFVSIARVGGSE